MGGTKRTAIGAAQRSRLLQEVAGKCPLCGLEAIASLELHHIDGDRSNSVDANLIALCASCHAQATKGIVEPEELARRKQALGCGWRPGASAASSMSVNATDNRGGVIAQHVHGDLVVKKQCKAALILPDSIGSSPAHYNYTEYLIGRLVDFQRAGAKVGRSPAAGAHPGSVKAILKRQLGGLPKDLPLERFVDVVRNLQERIDRTAIGRRNTAKGDRNYHTFEEHSALGRADK